jgi:hypothetical protein
MARIPLAMRLLVAAAFLYTVANFFTYMPMSGMGAPIVKEGRFFFNDHGIIREVTQSEFHTHQSILLRAYSGHWIFLYLLPAIALFTLKRQSSRPSATS